MIRAIMAGAALALCPCAADATYFAYQDSTFEHDIFMEGETEVADGFVGISDLQRFDGLYSIISGFTHTDYFYGKADLIDFNGIVRNGDFTFYSFHLGGDGKPGLAISKGTPPPVPEPASWTTMLVGMGLIGWGSRRRRSALAS